MEAMEVTRDEPLGESSKSLDRSFLYITSYVKKYHHCVVVLFQVELA